MGRHKKEIEKETETFIYEDKQSAINSVELKEIAENIEKTTLSESLNNNNDSADSFFRSVVNSLNDTSKDVSAKTEYLDVSENFVGSKIEFMADFGNMPYAKKWLNHFEIKRISLKRRGRQEMLMALRERQQEENREKLEDLSKRFGVM